MAVKSLSQHTPAVQSPALSIVGNTSRVQRDQLLTSSAACGSLDFPNDERPCRSLCPSQAGDNRGVFCFCHPITFTGVGNILAEQRPGVREAPAASHRPGSVVSPFFIPKTQNDEVYHA